MASISIAAISARVWASPGLALKVACHAGSAAFIGPPARTVLPPNDGNFSSKITSLPV